MNRDIGIVVLAAGAARRMGSQKLLLPLGGKSIVRRVVEAACESELGPVVVVTGSAADSVSAELTGLSLTTCYNQDWERGQASSVACGVESLSTCRAIIIVVADQPFLTSNHLHALANRFNETKCPIVASYTDGRRGNPVLFDGEVFSALTKLKGDQGARQLFDQNVVDEVDQEDPNLFWDVDTLQAYEEAKTRWLARYASRDNFPLLQNSACHNNELIYLDNAATTQIPAQVMQAQNEYECSAHANIHRGIYPLAEDSSEAYEQARNTVATFFGVQAQDLVFTHGATESLNLAILGWGERNLSAGDVVLIDTASHHAGIVPWQMLVQRIGIELAFIGLDSRGHIDRQHWQSLLGKKPKAVSLVHVSNVTGFETPAAALARDAHEVGATVFLDCTQSVPLIAQQTPELEADYVAVSAHKMYGPFGIGALWIRPGLAQKMQPLIGGGGMVGRVSESSYELSTSPSCFEAGTPNITGAVGFASACMFINHIGVGALQEHLRLLCHTSVERLSKISGVRLLGETDGKRSSLFSFLLEGVHPHDVAAQLAQKNIAVRAGHHCAMPLHSALGVPASVRVSFGAYSTEDDIELLERAVLHIKETFAHG